MPRMDMPMVMSRGMPIRATAKAAMTTSTPVRMAMPETAGTTRMAVMPMMLTAADRGATPMIMILPTRKGIMTTMATQKTTMMKRITKATITMTATTRMTMTILTTTAAAGRRKAGMRTRRMTSRAS